MPDAVAPRPAPTSVASPYAALWLDMFNQGATLCADAWRQWGDMVAAASAAQAQAARNLCFYASAAEGMGPSRMTPTSEEVLMLIEGQAERFADAVRETIHDLEQGQPPPGSPLPD